MFTGIVKSIGRVKSFQRKGQSAILLITAQLSEVEKGDSIAVNGACLTVEDYSNGILRFFVGTQTMKDTTLSLLRPGMEVNLETALHFGDKVGGHIISGHIKAVGKLISIRRQSKTTFFKVQAPVDFVSGLEEKGSVAVDGVSLTIQRKGRNFFEVMLIPETLNGTILGKKRIGDKLNLE